MTAPQKQGSKWGSFLQQAVAGVESRLDNLLADGIEEPAPTPKKATAPVTPTPAPASEGECHYCVSA